MPELVAAGKINIRTKKAHKIRKNKQQHQQQNNQNATSKVLINSNKSTQASITFTTSSQLWPHANTLIQPWMNVRSFS